MIANPRGRQPIAVNQPPGGGSLYPFVNPSGDILYLLGDFFVSFDDPRDEIQYPLRVAWMHGFGDNPVPAPPGWPAPTHAYDLIVVDAAGRRVFNSILAENFTATPWDDRLLVLEWTNGDSVCRCSLHTAWTQADIDDGQTRTYDTYITPANGELQADCWYKVPKRVTSIRVGLNYIDNQPIELAEGYNMGLTHATTLLRPTLDIASLRTTASLVAGTRNVSRIVMDASVGNGIGTKPSDCADHTVRTINRTKASNYQDFTIDPSGCIRVKRPVALSDNKPREFNYASFYPHLSGHPSIPMPPNQAAATLAFNNNCKNCCDCTYFAQTYQGLKRQWFLYRDVAQLAEKTRDTYNSNRDRWLVQKGIRENFKLRVRLSPDGNSKIRWGISFCNASKCCLAEMNVWLFWMISPDSRDYYERYYSSFPSAPISVDNGSGCDQPQLIQPIIYGEGDGVRGDTYRVPFDSCDAQAVITISGQQCFPMAKLLPLGKLKVRLYTFVHFNRQFPDPDTGLICYGSPVSWATVPLEVRQRVADLSLPVGDIYETYLTNYIPVDTSNPYCRRCLDCAGTPPF